MVNNNLGPPPHHRMRIRCAVPALGIAPNAPFLTLDQTFAIASCSEIRRRLVTLTFAGRKPSNREKLEGGNRKIFRATQQTSSQTGRDAKTTNQGVVATLQPSHHLPATITSSPHSTPAKVERRATRNTMHPAATEA